MTVLVPVLLAGGAGTRLWPLSQPDCPKQFLALEGERSLLQRAVARARSLPGATAPLVIGNERHRFLIAEQLRQAGVESGGIVLEPEGRNTAPAAAVAAQWVRDLHGAQARLLLMPADQLIDDAAAFAQRVAVAMAAAEQDRLVTFGIHPTSPETGYGYLRQGAPLPGVAGAFAVSAFHEKPDLDTARGYLAQGDCLWNGGLFLFRAQALLDELARLEPGLLSAASAALREARRDLDFLRLQPAAFRRCRRVSLDHAVMERSERVAVVPLDAGWDDVGSWNALTRQAADADGNHVRGDAVLADARRNLVHAGSRRVALLGVEDHLVVDSADTVLVAHRDRVQDVGRLVAQLQAGRGEGDAARGRVYRPWGYYETLASGPRFRVKRIEVRPGHQLSLQRHHHRAEHWIVVSGTAEVTCGERRFLLAPDQSAYIPLGEPHRLANPGKCPLQMIEVQSGSHLSEDDIVRLDDAYGRLLDGAG